MYTLKYTRARIQRKVRYTANNAAFKGIFLHETADAWSRNGHHGRCTQTDLFTYYGTASVRFKPIMLCSLYIELVPCANRMELACHVFLILKAVHFSLFKQTPFQRKQALFVRACDNEELHC